ncbi:quinone-dependent dihydroorotate dehydrogenase [Peterkaempfera bronchialis]|uniref:Dihydroorotate dehydrogenase (quinone) n=1 Tax=Peterkaempfera bronchialis TaxID=2126346 RepID=A0A345T429_9ACTN|nr:quinone-dependent dihydroorotate dehydrogenase [Peterkaempfera bronchialis]AXI80734.1 quinone-dependent dihydroorotate dehydrogenase [Peterkaempfera bronchialis]
MYRLLFDLLFRRLDPEKAHHLAFGWIRGVSAVPGLRALVRRVLAPQDPALRIRALGLDLPGPFGLAAGFDKNAVGIDGLTMVGFDHVEIGTVTGQAQPGNPTPRLFRLVEDRALINRMGFNNDGSAAVAARLAARPRSSTAVVGVNIGKTKAVPEQEAVTDYVTSAERLARHADYLVVNVSSPNTPGLRNLQAVDQLRPLLTAVREAADRSTGRSTGSTAGRRVPLLVKIAPDLADEDVDAVADLALELGLDGIIATNTTIGREGLRTDPATVAAAGAGGLSGAPLKQRSLEVLRRLYARTGGRLTLVAVGGVETADDAWERILAGATLVQGYSAFIYQGPFWARRIHRGLAARLRASGHAALADAVGSGAAATRTRDDH